MGSLHLGRRPAGRRAPTRFRTAGLAPSPGSRGSKARRARSTSPLGGPGGANRYRTPPARWVRTASTPVGYDRCMQLTIPFSKLSTPRLGSLRRASLARSRPPVSRRTAASASSPPHRSFLPGASVERTSDTPSPSGHSREHRAQFPKDVHTVSGDRPASGAAKPRSHGVEPVGLDALPRPSVNLVELDTPEVPSTLVPFPPTDDSDGAADPVVRKRTQTCRRVRELLQCQPTQGTSACLRPVPRFGPRRILPGSQSPRCVVERTRRRRANSTFFAKSGTTLPSAPFVAPALPS